MTTFQSSLLIRPETITDVPIIKTINNRAFGQVLEGNIIDKIRESDPDALSFVAEINKQIVGHIFYSSAEINCNQKTVSGMGLAPMAVLPEYQRKGIGKMLINKSIEILREKMIPFIIVLGHPDYYPKFGFEPAIKHGIQCQWEGIPSEAYMIMILDKEKMEGVSGVARYRDEWSEAV